jgi:hypothetical protein
MDSNISCFVFMQKRLLFTCVFVGEDSSFDACKFCSVGKIVLSGMRRS